MNYLEMLKSFDLTENKIYSVQLQSYKEFLSCTELTWCSAVDFLVKLGDVFISKKIVTEHDGVEIVVLDFQKLKLQYIPHKFESDNEKVKTEIMKLFDGQDGYCLQTVPSNFPSLGNYSWQKCVETFFEYVEEMKKDSKECNILVRRKCDGALLYLNLTQMPYFYTKFGVK